MRYIFILVEILLFATALSEMRVWLGRRVSHRKEKVRENTKD
jgi:hypothetical protein